MTKVQVGLFLKSFPFHYALKTALTLWVAILCNYYFSFSAEFWLILAAFCVSQTTRGTQFKQTIAYFFLLTSAVLFAYFLETYIPSRQISLTIVALFFIVCSYLSFVYRFLNEVALKICLFALFLLLALLTPAIHPDVIFNRVSDILLGTFIGYIIARLFFPLRIASAFKLAMIPFLQMMIQNCKAIEEYLFRVLTKKKVPEGEEEESAQNALVEVSVKLKKMLDPQSGIYPEWIYEAGFNPGLRAGFRFFLVKLERIIEILFSLEYLVSKALDANLLQEIKHDLSLTFSKNIELMEILITLMKDEGVSFQEKQIQSDFTSDIDALNQTVKRIIPGDVELLDISPDYVTLTNIVRNIKDMRELLLQLTFSFPTKK